MACSLWLLAYGVWLMAYGSAVYRLPEPINKTVDACGKNRTLPTYVINASDFSAALAAIPRWPVTNGLWPMDHVGH